MISTIKTAMIACSLLIAGSLSLDRPNSRAPLAFPAGQVKLRIAGVTFVTRLAGSNLRYEETEPNKYRALVLTVEVTKPADLELTLWAPDISLHYRHGRTEEVAVCFGLSSFTTQQQVDRQMTFFRLGYGRSTGLATTKATTVYVDIFFQYIEPDVSELHLFMAQPIGASISTKGWEPSTI